MRFSERKRRAARLATAATIAAASLSAPHVANAAPVPYDLSADGRAELAIGLPWASGAQGARATGAVAVIEGSKAKLFGKAALFTPADLGLAADAAKPYAGVGTALASGDFDGDGVADLAAGAPGAGRSGAVALVYGDSGFRATRKALVAAPTTDDYTAFGASLVAGDLNRDGYDDLVAGATGADPRPEADYGAGAVHVLYGSAAGLTETGRVKLDRPDPALAAFGIRLALGDTDGDGRPDLVEGGEGAPQWSDDPPTPGHLTAARNAGTGPAAPAGVETAMKGGPASIAIGDVNGDGYADVVAGVPTDKYVGEDETAPAGSVRVYFGGRDGLAAKPAVVSQRTRGIPGSAEAGDLFGHSVAVGRVDGDRYADIVVGAPGEDGTRGRVTVIRGAKGTAGHARKGHYAIDQDTKGLPGKRRAAHRFGASVTLLDLTGDGRRELAVTASGDDKGTGTVTALRAVKGGLATKGARRLAIRSVGVAAADSYAYPETRVGRHASS